MTMPRSLAAYSDCETEFDKALASPYGTSILLDSPQTATRFRQKLHTLRTLLRRQSEKTYPSDDQRHGTSPYDHFHITIDLENSSRLFVKPYRLNVVSSEQLSSPE